MSADAFFEGYALTVADDGTITAPAEISAALQLAPGEYLLVHLAPDEAAVVLIAPAPRGVERTGNVLNGPWRP